MSNESQQEKLSIEEWRDYLQELISEASILFESAESDLESQNEVDE